MLGVRQVQHGAEESGQPWAHRDRVFRVQLVWELASSWYARQSSGFGGTDLSPSGSVDTTSHHGTSPQRLTTWHPVIPLFWWLHVWSLYKRTQALCVFYFSDVPKVSIRASGPPSPGTLGSKA